MLVPSYEPEDWRCHCDHRWKAERRRVDSVLGCVQTRRRQDHVRQPRTQAPQTASNTHQRYPIMMTPIRQQTNSCTVNLRTGWFTKTFIQNVTVTSDQIIALNVTLQHVNCPIHSSSSLWLNWQCVGLSPSCLLVQCQQESTMTSLSQLSSHNVYSYRYDLQWYQSATAVTIISGHVYQLEVWPKSVVWHISCVLNILSLGKALDLLLLSICQCTL